MTSNFQREFEHDLESLLAEAAPLLARATRLSNEGDAPARAAARTLALRLDTLEQLVFFIRPVMTHDQDFAADLMGRTMRVEDALQGVAAALFGADGAHIARASRVLGERLEFVLADRKRIQVAQESRNEAAEIYESLRSALFAARTQDAEWSHEFGLDATHPGQETGLQADLALGPMYNESAHSERRMSLFWAMIALFAILALGGVSAWAVGEAGDGVMDWLGRLAIGLAPAALIPYAVAESRDHRRHARWAENRSIQLRTLDPFTRRMSPDGREALVASFGSVVFGERDAHEIATADEHLGTAGSEALQLAEQVLEIVRRNISR